MSVRIYQPAKSAMTSGMAKTAGWVLEFPSQAERPIDPLMGWTGQADTQAQVKLTFPTLEAARDYAAKHGLAARVEQPNKRKHRPRGYGDNFAYARKVPWSH